MQLTSLITILFISALLFPSAPALAQGKEQELPRKIRLAVASDVLADYKVFINGRSPETITEYSGDKSRRDVIEVVLFQQALLLGGLKAKIDLIPEPTYLRMGQDLRSGFVDGVGSSMWLSDLEGFGEEVLISRPLIRNGEFEAGLYSSPNNAKALGTQTRQELRELTAACNRHWVADWLTLKNLDVPQITHVQSWKTMVKMVANMRADFLLAPFQPTKGMLLHVEGMTLAPIPGIKVGLEGSRHFGVTACSEESRAIFEALERGLAIMERQGTIKKAYRQSGFFNIQAQKWIRLNEN